MDHEAVNEAIPKWLKRIEKIATLKNGGYPNVKADDLMKKLAQARHRDNELLAQFGEVSEEEDSQIEQEVRAKAHQKDFKTAANQDTMFYSQGPMYDKLQEFETPETKKIFSVLKRRVNYKEFRGSEDKTDKIRTPNVELISDVHYSDDGRENMNSESYKRKQEAEQKLLELQQRRASRR